MDQAFDANPTELIHELKSIVSKMSEARELIHLMPILSWTQISMTRSLFSAAMIICRMDIER